jgi:two-component sensor histidine kinase
VIVVADNGRGVSEEAQGAPERLGLRLVRGLIEDQLKGSMETVCEGGTRFTIRFTRKA